MVEPSNMSRYMISYLRIKLDPTLSYEESIWIFASCTMCQGLSACIGGILLKKFGPRKTALLGTLIFWCWFPDKEGLVSGLIVAGIGGGAVIFDPIQTAYLNPKNKIPDQQGHGKDRQSDILDNVPTCILILGLCYTGIQLIGSLLLVNPRMGICQRYIEDWDNSSINDKNEGNKREYTPREVLRNKFLYILWFIFLLNGQAIVGSLAAACNGGGRLLWGILSDKYSVRTSLILSSGLMCILMLTFNVTSLVSRELYVVYVCLLFLSLSGNSVLLPTATAKAFGKEHYGVNFGIIYTACIITSPLSAVLTSNLKNRIGWDGMFYMIAAFSFI
ncbi:hypothetical protein KUTeg_012257, partial [Tegillarca granosa]